MSEMSEMIERVADGMHAALTDALASADVEVYGRHEPIWGVLARAAIEAMREPTEAMMVAGSAVPAMLDADRVLRNAVARTPLQGIGWFERGEKPPLHQSFAAMIDAALSSAEPVEGKVPGTNTP